MTEVGLQLNKELHTYLYPCIPSATMCVTCAMRKEFVYVRSRKTEHKWFDVDVDHISTFSPQKELVEMFSGWWALHG